MQKNCIVIILLLFQAAWSVQILGTREFGTKCHLNLLHTPAIEKIGAFKINLRVAENVDVPTVTTDAASKGAWSQIKPGLSRKGNLIEVLCIGPALMHSRMTDTIEMCRISFDITEASAGLPLFDGIIDSVWFDECFDIQGEKTVFQFNRITVAAKQMRTSASRRARVEYQGIGRIHSLSFLLTENEHVRARVVDIHGRLVSKLTDQMYTPGLHSVRWPRNNRQLPSGTYFMQLEIRKYTYNKKVNYYR